MESIQVEVVVEGGGGGGGGGGGVGGGYKLQVYNTCVQLRLKNRVLIRETVRLCTASLNVPSQQQQKTFFRRKSQITLAGNLHVKCMYLYRCWPSNLSLASHIHRQGPCKIRKTI